MSQALKIHKHLVEQTVRALQEVFGQNKYADKTVDQYLKFNKKWGARDRRFFAENVYEIVRWWRKLWFEIGFDQMPQSGDLTTENLLKIWGAWWLSQEQELPTWFEYKNLKLRSIQAQTPLRIKESFPDWLAELGEKSFGERWPAIAHALNQKAHVCLRVNSLKADVASVQKELSLAEIQTTLFDGAPLLKSSGLKSYSVPHGLALVQRKNVFVTPTYLKGGFEVQDFASQLIAPLLNPQPGSRVIDACAGAGGKSLHLAALMKNKGKIIALDIHDWKLKELKKRAARAGVDIIETRLIENQKVLKRLEGQADYLLLDVPCSSLGVLRRNPSTKWMLKQEQLVETISLQKQILGEYTNMLKAGGFLVYSTCSILPEENEKQIASFIKSSQNKWELVEEIKIYPDQYAMDGFYAAKLKKL